MNRSSNKIPLEWLKTAKGKDAEQLEITLRNATIALGEVRRILKERLRDLETKEMSESEYENPSWAYKQAHINGGKSELTRLIKLTDFIGDSR